MIVVNVKMVQYGIVVLWLVIVEQMELLGMVQLVDVEMGQLGIVLVNNVLVQMVQLGVQQVKHVNVQMVQIGIVQI